ncbi:MAG: YaiO family outer membrane beta-barrel protein [Lysobacteraceae bacterium]
MTPLFLLLQATAPAAVATAAPAGSYLQQLQQARELATSGHKDEAIALYTTLLQRYPGDADLLLGRGRTQAWSGRWPEAEADLRAVVDAHPQYADAWSALGDAYLWSDRPALAAEAYAHWSEVAPQDPAALVALGRAQRAAGNRDAARAAFEAAAARGLSAGEVASEIATLEPPPKDPDVAVPSGYRWSLRIGAEHTWFDPSRQAWNDETATLRRHFARGSLALEMLHADRFGSSDTAWALDAYAPLWQRAYANFRVQHGPQGGLFAERSWRAEVFQGVGTGWELSASYDRLEFANSDVDMYGLGIGRYLGDWYLRYRALRVPGIGEGSLSHRGLARYYYAGNADDYVEVSGGTGRSVDSATGLAEDAVRRSSASFGVAWVRFFSPRWGVKLGADLANNTEGGYDERSVSAALYTRW